MKNLLQTYKTTGTDTFCGSSSLILASAEGHLEVVKYLVSEGADIHAENDCAARWASRKGHLEVVKYLVLEGADIHAEYL